MAPHWIARSLSSPSHHLLAPFLHGQTFLRGDRGLSLLSLLYSDLPHHPQHIFLVQNRWYFLGHEGTWLKTKAKHNTDKLMETCQANACSKVCYLEYHCCFSFTHAWRKLYHEVLGYFWIGLHHRVYSLLQGFYRNILHALLQMQRSFNETRCFNTLKVVKNW